MNSAQSVSENEKYVHDLMWSLLAAIIHSFATSSHGWPKSSNGIHSSWRACVCSFSSLFSPTHFKDDQWHFDIGIWQAIRLEVLNAVMLKRIQYQFCHLWSGVAVLKINIVGISLHKKQHGGEDLIDTPSSCQVTLSKEKVCLSFKCHIGDGR